jgi:TetR/AcrR family transcriptional regulator
MTVRASRLPPKKAARSPETGTRGARIGKAAAKPAVKSVVKAVARVSDAAAQSLFARGEQYQRKKQELLRAAVRVFNQSGAVNTSLEDVARELGITKAAIYYYFESKQEILYECYCMSLDLADDIVAHAREHGRTGRDKLRLYIRRFVEQGLSELNPTMGLRQQLTLEPRYLKKLVGRRRAHRDGVRALIAEGVRDGSIVNCNPAVLQSMIAGAHSWLFMSFRRDGDMSAVEMAEAVTELMAGGFEARPAPRTAVHSNMRTSARSAARPAAAARARS